MLLCDRFHVRGKLGTGSTWALWGVNTLKVANFHWSNAELFGNTFE